MIKVKKSDLQNWSMLNAKVLVKPDRNTNELLLKSGTKLQFQISFNVGQHAQIRGEVIATPRSLDCRLLMDWETKVELEPGMVAWWRFVDSLNALERGQYLVDEHGNVYLIIPYQSVVVARDKNGNSLTVNGFLLCEPVEEKSIQTQGFVIPDHILKAKSVKFGILRYQGATNGWYRVSIYHDPKERALNGSLIVFSKYSDIPLEYNLHSTFEDKKIYYRMQWPDVLAVIPPEMYESVGVKVIS